VATLPSGESHITYRMRDGVGLIAILDILKNRKSLSPLQGIETCIVQPVDCSVYWLHCPGYPAYVPCPKDCGWWRVLHLNPYKKTRKTKSSV